MNLPTTPFSLTEHLILLARRGSEAHGLYTADSDDRDLMGVVIPPIDYYFGLKSWDGAESIKEEWDVVLYELRKFVSLLCKQNPNVLSILWLREQDYLTVTEVGLLLLKNRDLFRAREPAFRAFCGYADGQLKRMNRPGRDLGEKRRKLIEKFGFDPKNSCHLIRLLRMGKEYLLTGQLNVRRTDDREELLAIKRGEWSKDKIEREAALLFEECSKAVKKSPLPEEINLEQVGELLVSLITQQLEKPELGTRSGTM